MEKIKISHEDMACEGYSPAPEKFREVSDALRALFSSYGIEKYLVAAGSPDGIHYLSEGMCNHEMVDISTTLVEVACVSSKKRGKK